MIPLGILAQQQLGFQPADPIELVGSNFVYGSYTVNKPVGTIEGDVLIAQANSRNNYITTISDGWTPLWQHAIANVGDFRVRGGADNEETHAWYKFAGISEPASYTITSQNTQMGLGISVFRNVNGVTHEVSANTNVCPDITGFVDAWLLALHGTSYEQVAHPTVPVGMTEVDHIYDAGYDVGTMLAYELLSSSGLTGTRTFTGDLWNEYAVAGSIILEPLPDIGTPPILELPAPGLIVHLDASNVASYPGSGTVWTDLSGNGNDATLVGSPVFNAILMEGVFEFPGSTSVHAKIAGTLLDLRTVPHTISYVSRYGSGAKGRILGSDATTNWLGGYQLANTNRYHAGAWVIQGTGDGTAWQHVTFTGDTGVDLWEMFVNGISIQAANALGNTGPYGLRMGSDGVYGEPSDCDLGWLVVYDRILTPTEITELHNYIKDRYSL